VKVAHAPHVLRAVQDGLGVVLLVQQEVVELVGDTPLEAEGQRGVIAANSMCSVCVHTHKAHTHA
jgi:hypothetical protein